MEASLFLQRWAGWATNHGSWHAFDVGGLFDSLKAKAPIFSDLLQKAAIFLKVNKGTSTDLIGLDISPDFLKLIKIRCYNKPYKIEHLAIAPLPSGVIVKDEIKDFTQISEALKALVSQAGIETKDVALAIPRSLAIIKNITIDSRLTMDEIESRAWIEANRHFPDLIDNIFLDFSIIGPSAQDSSQLEVVLVACRKEHLQPYLEVLGLAGLNPRVVDVNSYALERALPLVIPAAEQAETIALLNLNTNLSTFIVMQSGQLLYAHDQPYDGQRLLTQVRTYCKNKGLNLAQDDAQLLNDPAYNGILQENLISHLRHTVHVFFTSKPNVNIEKIYLAGDCAVIANVAYFITREIGIHTQVVNPLLSLELGSGIKEDEFKMHAPALMLCCGLALSNVE